MGTTELIVEPGRQDVVVVHDFDVAPDVAFRAYTDPGLMPRWKGADRFAVVVDEHDLRVGGRWRLVMTRTDGVEYPMRGVFHEVSTPDRLVSTSEFEAGGPGALQLVVETFEPTPTGCRLTSVSLFASVEDRDRWVPSGGLESGTRAMMARLDEVVAS
jgi:uncharacterized protein YndB with AHSA1/START domain